MIAKPLCCLVAVGLALCSTAAHAGDEGPAAAAFERASRKLLSDWSERRQAFAQELASVETARAHARTLERRRPPDGDWRRAWAKVEKLRKQMHAVHEKSMSPWTRALKAVAAADSVQALAASDRDRAARRCLDVLRTRLAGGEPGVVLEALAAAERAALTTVCGWSQEPNARRRLLAAVADRLAATPGTSDLDVLCGVVQWDAIFLGSLTAGRAQLEAVSTDLILIFTERAANGIKLSRSKLYRRRGFSARGFRAPLRDGSDQVRHFTWAFRMFARSKNNASMEKLLALKERADATQRKQPLNQADLALNRAARSLVEQILGERSAPEGAHPERRPLSAAHYADAFRKGLQ